MLYTIHRLRPREVPVAVEDIDPLTRGTIVHDVLFALLTELRGKGQLPIQDGTVDAVRERLDQLLDEHAGAFEDTLKPAIPRIWRDAIQSIRADLREWLRRQSAALSCEPRK